MGEGLNIPPRESLWTFLREDVPQPRYIVYAVNVAVVCWTFGGIYALVELLR